MSRGAGAAHRVIPYALEQLFVDQPSDWVIDSIAPVLAWVPGASPTKRQQPFRFEVEHVEGPVVEKVRIDIRWDEAALERAISGVVDHARRLREGRSVQREHLAELAAYGLTFVAISTLMPGRRVVHMQMGMAPDILFDLTPDALRGVETAGRTSGGRHSRPYGTAPAPPPGEARGTCSSRGGTSPRSTFCSGALRRGSASWSG